MKKVVYMIFAAAVAAILSAGCEKPENSEEKTYCIEDFSGQWGSCYGSRITSVIDISNTEQGTIILASVPETDVSGNEKVNAVIDYEIKDYEIDQSTGMLKFKTSGEDGQSYAVIVWDGELYLTSERLGNFGRLFTRLSDPVEFLPRPEMKTIR